MQLRAIGRTTTTFAANWERHLITPCGRAGDRAEVRRPTITIIRHGFAVARVVHVCGVMRAPELARRGGIDRSERLPHIHTYIVNKRHKIAAAARQIAHSTWHEKAAAHPPPSTEPLI